MSRADEVGKVGKVGFHVEGCGGLHVRRLALQDAAAWAAYACLPVVQQHTSSTAASVADVADVIGRGLAGGASAPLHFGLFEDGTGALIGTVGFHTLSARNRSAEIFDDVTPAHWGRGIATAACAAATRWALQVQGWHRVPATVLPANAASRRVLLHCGYAFEGQLWNFRVVRGLPADDLLFAAVPTTAGAEP